jgi:hypothetical protein
MFVQDSEKHLAFRVNKYQLQVGDRVKNTYWEKVGTRSTQIVFEGIILTINDELAVVCTPMKDVKKFKLSALKYSLLQYDNDTKRDLMGKKYQIDLNSVVLHDSGSIQVPESAKIKHH